MHEKRNFKQSTIHKAYAQNIEVYGYNQTSTSLAQLWQQPISNVRSVASLK